MNGTTLVFHSLYQNNRFLGIGVGSALKVRKIHCFEMYSL